MTGDRVVEIAGQAYDVTARHRLELAIDPRDRLTRAPVAVRVGREAPRPPLRAIRRGRPLDPEAERLDVPLRRYGTSTFLLLHRLDATLPPPPPGGEPPVRELVIRLTDPTRQYVARRLRVPVWTRRAVEHVDDDPPGSVIRADARTVQPWLLPGSGYRGAGGGTGLRGRIVRGSAPVAWPRVQALGPAGEILGHAHGDERGEFLLYLETVGTLAPAPGTIPIRLAVWMLDTAAVPPPDVQIAAGDPLGGLVVEDAVARGPADPPGALHPDVLAGVRIPASYVAAGLAVRPPEAFTVGRLVQPEPYVLA